MKNVSSFAFYSLLVYATSRCFAEESVEMARDGNVPDGLHEETPPWISEIFAEAERRFEIHPEASDECKNDFNLYKLHLKNNSLWAVRMSEASHWPKHGFLSGTTHFFGYFDECTTINAYNIKGQHCSVESVYHLNEAPFATPPSVPVDALSNENSVWWTLQMYTDPNTTEFRIERNRLRWTLCTPSSCSNSDLIESLRRTLNATFGKYSINITADVKKGGCHTIETEEDRPIMYYYVKYFFYSLAAIVMFSSLVVAISNKPVGRQKCSSLVECFSIQKNYHDLTDFVPEREYMFMHGCKILFVVTMIFFHSVFFKVLTQLYDANASERLLHVLNSFIIGGPELPDAMFFFSGYLMYKSFVASNNDFGFLDILTKIFKRWIRLFSTYLVLRLFYTYVFPAMNNGVLWHELQIDAAHCETDLLSALLTLPSTRSGDKLCLHGSWQIAIDLQLFIIGYTCLSLCRRFKVSESKALSSLIAVAIAATAYSIFRNDYKTLFFMDARRPIVERSDRNYVVYHTTYYSLSARVGPYVIGALTCLIAQKLKEKRYVLTKMQIIGGFAIAFYVKKILTGVAWKIYEQTAKNEYRRFWHVLYGGLYHSLSNSVIYFLFLVYFANRFLFEWFEERLPRITVPLSRLSYLVSLMNIFVILSHTFSQRTLSTHTNPYSLLHLVLADTVLTYFLAFFLYLLVEGPVQNLIFFTSSSRRSETRDNPKTS